MSYIYSLGTCIIFIFLVYLFLRKYHTPATRIFSERIPKLSELFHNYQKSCKAIHHLDKNNKDLLHILEDNTYTSEDKSLGNTLYQRLENMSVKLERIKQEKNLLGKYLYRVSDYLKNHHNTRNSGLNNQKGLQKFKKTLHNLRSNPVMPMGTVSKWQKQNQKIDRELSKITGKLKGLDKETKEAIQDSLGEQHYRPTENQAVKQQISKYMKKVIPPPDKDPRKDYWDRAKKVTAGNSSTADKPQGLHKDIDYFDNTGCNEPRPGCCPFPNDVKGRCFYDMRVEQLEGVSKNDRMAIFKSKRYKELEEEIIPQLYASSPIDMMKFKKKKDKNSVEIMREQDMYRLGKGSNKKIFKDWIKNPKSIPPMCRQWKFHDDKRKKWCVKNPLPILWKYKFYKKQKECPKCPHGLQKIHPIWPNKDVYSINSKLNQLKMMYSNPKNRKKVLDML